MHVNQIKTFFKNFPEKLRAGDKGALAFFVPMVFLLAFCLFLTVIFVPRLFSTRAANAGAQDSRAGSAASLRYDFSLLPTQPQPPSVSEETQAETTALQPPINVEIEKPVPKDPEGKIPDRGDTGPEVEVTPAPPPPPIQPENPGGTDGGRFLYFSTQGLNGFQNLGGLRYYFQNGATLNSGMHTLNGGVRYRVNNYGAISSKMGIDISQWNGTVNWNVAKNAGVEYAILRCAYRGYGDAGNKKEDEMFETNFRSAKAAGVPVGIYFFSQATNAAEGKDEALAAIQLAEKYGGGLQYPIYIDSENSDNYPNGRADQISKQARTEAVKAFCETVKAYGYTPGIYASASWFTDKLDFLQVAGYEIWVAHYTANSQPGFSKHWGMWQYTAELKIPGLQTGIATVDANIAVFDYAARNDMSELGKNHILLSSQGEVDVYMAAENAVKKAEDELSQPVYDAALSKVNDLMNVRVKHALLARLKAIENKLTTVPPVTDTSSEHSTVQAPIL